MVLKGLLHRALMVNSQRRSGRQDCMATVKTLGEKILISAGDFAQYTSRDHAKKSKKE